MGLLDFLNTDDARLGLGLLAAGGPSTQPLSVGQRVAGAMQGLDAQKQDKMRIGLLQSQIDENAAQRDMQRQKLAMSQRQMDMDERFYGGVPAAAPLQSGATPAVQGVGAPTEVIPERAAGLPKAVAAFAQGTPATFAGVAMTAPQLAEKFGLPIEQIIFDYRQNGGKKIAEMIAERSKPNWMNVNGNLVNTNAPGFQGGVQGGVAASNDGRVTQYMPDGRGGLVVGAPKGALETYAAFQGVSNRSSADFTPQEIIGPSGRKVVVPRSQVLQPGTAGGYRTEGDMRATAAGDMGADPKAIEREIRATQNDLMKPGLDEPSKAALRAHIADLQGQGQRIGAPAVAGNVVELAPAELAANEAARVRAVDTAKADVARDTSRAADTKKAGQMREASSTALKLLDSNPTGSGVGALADTVGNFVGQPMKSATVAQQLEALGGWMVANVPRMEGPQSDADVRNYASMAGRVGDRTLPVAVRKEALKTVMELQEKYSDLNGGATPQSKPAGGPKPPIPMKGMVQDGYKFKGGNPADSSNWEKM